MNRRQAAMAGAGALLLKLFGRKTPKPPPECLPEKPLSYDDFPSETAETDRWMEQELYRLEWDCFPTTGDPGLPHNITLHGGEKQTVKEWWVAEILPGMRLSLINPPTPGQMRNQELLLGWKWRKVVQKT